MNNTIGKFNVPIQDRFTVDICYDFAPLVFKRQGNRFVMYLLIDLEVETESKEEVFRVFGTGQTIISEQNLNFIGTVVDDKQMVWHLFHETPKLCPALREKKFFGN